MSYAAMVWLGLIVSQNAGAAPAEQPKQGRTAEDFDEDMIAGHPDLEPLPHPKGVDWSLDKAQTESTSRRKRLTLAGKWRFAAQPEKKSETLRKEMGWLEMPAGKPEAWQVFSGNLKPVKQWKGKPPGDYPWAWIERDLHAPVDWVKHQVFLVVRGPWSEAELFVAYQPVAGVERDGGKWFEITESLIYGGDAPLAMRLDVKEAVSRDSAKAEPYIGLELLPTGPRFDGLTVRQDPDKGELELRFDLRRPKFILGLPVRLPEIPLIVQFRLEDAETGAVLQRFDQHIGPMPEETRNVALRVAWSKEGAEPPRRARLRGRLTSVYGGNMDSFYPQEFEPQKLEKVWTENTR